MRRFHTLQTPPSSPLLGMCVTFSILLCKTVRSCCRRKRNGGSTRTMTGTDTKFLGFLSAPVITSRSGAQKHGVFAYNLSMQIVALLLFAALQAAAPGQTSATARGDRFQIAVPQGWKVLTSGTDVVLEHSSGASLLVVRVEATRNLADYAQIQAERIMSPLGFAKLSEPRSYKDAKDEW